jgi:hypothetical protein
MENLLYAIWMEVDYQREWQQTSRQSYLLFTYDLRRMLFGR